MAQDNTVDHLVFEEKTFCFMEQLFRLAFSRTGNEQDAEDIVQETYFKAFRSFQTLREDAHVKRWLIQILLNVLVDFRRKEKRTISAVGMTGFSEDDFADVNQASAEDIICQNEVDPRLLVALKTMPKIFLEPLILREIDDASYDEIAEILEIPKGTVMSRLSRARTYLRKALAPSLNSARS